MTVDLVLIVNLRALALTKLGLLFNIKFCLSFCCLAIFLVIFYLSYYYEQIITLYILFIHPYEGYYFTFASFIPIVPSKNSLPFSISRSNKTWASSLAGGIRGYSTGRTYSTKPSKNSLDLVKNFFKKYPSSELAEANINYDLINSIFRGHIKDYQFSEKAFNLLLSLKDPIIFDKLPLDNIERVYFREVIGITKRGIDSNAGVYIFTNKTNGKRYVGSSLTLSSRLSDDYLRKGKILGARAIELAIKKYGLSNFKLEIYVFSEELKDLVFAGKVDNVYGLEYKKVMKNLVLALEQIFILRLNPEYNELKVAGINVGLKVTPESMVPRFLAFAEQRQGLKKTRKVEVRSSHYWW
jgi:hypothetical protein